MEISIITKTLSKKPAKILSKQIVARPRRVRKISQLFNTPFSPPVVSPQPKENSYNPPLRPINWSSVRAVLDQN